MKKTITQLIDHANILNTEVKELEVALIKLRGKDWQDGLNQDTRVSVKILRGAYERAVIARDTFMDGEVELDGE